MRAEWTLSGRDAIARADEALRIADPFRVYIVDGSMPRVNGIETAQAIREAVGDESPLILMPACDWTDIDRDARAAGVSGFLNKPLFASELRQTLERSLSRPSDEAPVQACKPTAAGCLTGKRILLAEDNELNREIATEILQGKGLLVDGVENGQQACDKFQKAEPGYYDLILMDIQMPIMDGYAATRAIHRLLVGAHREPLWGLQHVSNCCASYDIYCRSAVKGTR